MLGAILREALGQSLVCKLTAGDPDVFVDFVDADALTGEPGVVCPRCYWT
jgi:hypothetical protein